MLYVELHSHTASQQLHSSWGGIVPNAAWRLLWAIAKLKGENEKICIPGFYDRVRPLSKQDIEMLARLDFGEAAWKEQFEIDQYLLDFSMNELLEAYFYRPTCTVCGLEGGYTGPGQKTVLPNSALAKLDFRLVPDQDPDEILELLEQHLADCGFADIEVKVCSRKPAGRTPPNDPLVTAAIDAAKSVYGKRPQIYPTSAGSGPMAILCHKYGIPAVSVGLGYWGSNTHAPNENIRLEDFSKGMRHIAAIMYLYADISSH